jgi:DNA primase large subunit
MSSEKSNNEPPKDLFSVIGTILKDCSSKWNDNATENLEIFSRDMQSIYNQFGALVYQKSNMLDMTAEEIRQRTADDLYGAIKFGVLSSRNNCKYIHQSTCQNRHILDLVQKRLSESGFSVTYEIEEKWTRIIVIW